MEKRPRENAVYVTGLSMDVSDEELAGLFGSIGVIKVGLFKFITVDLNFHSQRY